MTPEIKPDLQTRLDQIERLCRLAAANRTIDRMSRKLFETLADCACGAVTIVEQ